MPLEELTGLAADEDCLHCHLGPLISAWMDAHPDKSDEQILGEVAQILGEMLGSNAHQANQVDNLEKDLQTLVGIVRENATDIIRHYRTRRS